MATDNSRRVVMSCDCRNLAHVFALEYLEWPFGIEPELYIETIMNPYLPWYARIWPAIKYVLGRGEASVNSSVINSDNAYTILGVTMTYLEGYDRFLEEREQKACVQALETQ